MKWPDRLVAMGAFTSLFSGYLFMKGAAVNDAQFFFRIGLLCFGALLVAIGVVLKATRTR
jgi:hypothetical protein